MVSSKSSSLVSIVERHAEADMTASSSQQVMDTEFGGEEARQILVFVFIRELFGTMAR